MKLSELKSDEYEVIEDKPLRLSELNDDYEIVADFSSQIPSSDTDLLREGGKALLDTLGFAGEQYEKYATAPARAAIGAAQSGDNPFTAFSEQFGGDPRQAPTGQDLVKRAGVPDRDVDLGGGDSSSLLGFLPEGTAVNPSKVAGAAMEFVADPLLAVPAAKLAKPIELGAKAAKATQKGVQKAGKSIVGGSIKAFSKLAEAATAIPAKRIETYISNYDDVTQMMGDIPGAADKIRENLISGLRWKKAEHGKTIKQALGEAGIEKNISVQPVIESLEDYKTRLHQVYNSDDISQVDDLIEIINDGGRAINAQELNQLKSFLQDRAQKSYMKSGQTFETGREAQQAAKAAARNARLLLEEEVPGVVGPNRELAEMHKLEEYLNKNLMTPGKPEASLLSAGSETHLRNQTNLKKLSEKSGVEASRESEKLAAAESFRDPGLIPADTTGKSLTRLMMGAGLGSAIGGPTGSMIGLAFTSPQTLKMAIRAGQVPKRVLGLLGSKSGELTDKALDAVIQSSQSKSGQNVLKALGKASQMVSTSKNSKVAGAEDGKKSIADVSQLKGRDKWAFNGYIKLLEHDRKRFASDKVVEKLFKSPQGRNLLITASDLSPKSKAMNSLLKKYHQEAK